MRENRFAQTQIRPINAIAWKSSMLVVESETRKEAQTKTNIGGNIKKSYVIN